ncbi:uncharacterized protein LOC27207736 isoform X2 [Drosophila simulans]|uniref:uncharacterized protein LOC27207736 isoform X2 n=1 Tax=Drosophila simulans TaxID=7240 RepID=UPI001D100882|nr:uncharacterized protein LOC27207736 isoform X2 [Drosophila simulans]
MHSYSVFHAFPLRRTPGGVFSILIALLRRRTGLIFFGDYSICWHLCVYLTPCWWGLSYPSGVT